MIRGEPGASLVVMIDAPYGLQEALIGLCAGRGGTAPPLVVTAAGDRQQVAHERNRMLAFVASDQGVLHFDCLARRTPRLFLRKCSPLPDAPDPA